jgi:cathepsin L
MEGRFAIATGSLRSLSEQQLMDCSTKYGNNACNGGLMDYAFNYTVENKVSW